MAKGKYEKWLEPENLLRVEGWARDGLTDEDIAANMGISRSTLNDWKNKHSDISDALKKGEEVVDRQDENPFQPRSGFYFAQLFIFFEIFVNKAVYEAVHGSAVFFGGFFKSFILFSVNPNTKLLSLFKILFLCKVFIVAHVTFPFSFLKARKQLPSLPILRKL